MQYCCDAFRKANQRGTDNELYGAAIWMIDDNRFLIGCGDYHHISFCPWCGTHFDTEANPERSEDARAGRSAESRCSTAEISNPNNKEANNE